MDNRTHYVCYVEQHGRMRTRLDIVTLLEDFEIWSHDFWCLKSAQLPAQRKGKIMSFGRESISPERGTELASFRVTNVSPW